MFLLKYFTKPKLNMSDSEYTTDAMPSPPRDKENVYRKYENKKPKVPEENVEEEDEEEIQNKRNDTNSNSIPPPNNHGFNNRPTQRVYCIQVTSSNNTHIGNVMYQTFLNKKQEEKKEPIRETEKMAALKTSSKPVLDEDIDVVKNYIGFEWRQTFRHLGFKDPQLDQSIIKFGDEVKERIRWLLVDWKQAKGKKGATVGVLANALWDSNQHEALKEWSLQFDELHK